jgi:hypothetical protein
LSNVKNAPGRKITAFAFSPVAAFTAEPVGFEYRKSAVGNTSTTPLPNGVAPPGAPPTCTSNVLP